MKETVKPIQIKKNKISHEVDAALYIFEIYLQPIFPEILETLNGLEDGLKKDVKEVFDSHISELSSCGDLLFKAKDFNTVF